MERKTALVFGASGLTGRYLIDELVKRNIYDKIKIFGRSKFEINNSVGEFYFIDFENLGNYTVEIRGDDLFCCLGTTVKKAGSQKATEKVDFDYPVVIAKIAEANKIEKFIIVSTIGANAKSASFYLRTKGKMEETIRNMSFKKLHSLRPSMLLGERNEKRFGEAIGKFFVKFIKHILVGKLRRYRGIHGRDVAKAMIYLANNEYVDFVIESEKIKELADI